MRIFLLKKLNSGAGYAMDAAKKAMLARMARMRAEPPGNGCLKIPTGTGILVLDG
jgi:hypothetical protein